MPATAQATLRDHLAELVQGRGAHLSFDDAIDGLPGGLRGHKPDGQPHTIWRLVEHMRIAQHDILAYIDNSGPELHWPDDYWPVADEPPNRTAWMHSVEGFQEDADQLAAIAQDSDIDLLAPLPHDENKSAARQIMLAADHNAYHLAQVVMLRRLMHDWHG